MFGKIRHIHFVGIGGIGMSGLAVIMRNLGFQVSGSDIQRSEITRRLTRMGIKVSYAHRSENITGADVVVYSTAVGDQNPELNQARQSNIPIIHRGDLLAELTRFKISVCISGTHGKTTTTSLVGEVLKGGGLSPTIVVGGIIKGKSQARLGRGDFLVCEVDESDKSFLKLFPSYIIITNIEAEHLDHYKDLEEIKDNFVYFGTHTPFWGSIFLGIDSPGSFEIKERLPKRIITYGLSDLASLKAEGIERVDFGSSFGVCYRGRKIGRFRINLPGIHNVANTLAAIGIGLELGISAERIKQALEGFRGVHRRIEYLGDVRGAKIYDDYGHHPTEIAVTLQTLREYYPKQRIISIFQPHRYTRTYHLFDKFAIAFLHADVVVVTDIYPAHEVPIPGVNSESLVKRISKEQDSVYYIVEFDEIIRFLKKNLKAGDIVVIQGAGNINRIAKMILEDLK